MRHLEGLREIPKYNRRLIMNPRKDEKEGKRDERMNGRKEEMVGDE